MSTIDLKEHLGKDPVREAVITDCIALIDAQVKAKSGLSGVAIKGAYGTIKRIKKGFVRGTIDSLLDDWLDKLQPYYETWMSGGKKGSLADFLSARSDEVAEDLLSVTDARAERSTHKTAKKAYKKMRGSAKKNVVEAIPELGRVLEKHLDGNAPE